jgi:hypothetical protein
MRTTAYVVTALFSCVIGNARPAHAAPITYQFVQTGATLPGLELHASITLEDPAAGLPTLSCTIQGAYSPPCDIDGFGNLLSLTFGRGTAAGFNYSLFDFHTSQLPGGFPFPFLEWSIAPGFIHFNNSMDEFFIYGAGAAGPGSIRLNSDLGTCSFSGDLCVASGEWTPVTPVPELPTNPAVAAGLMALFLTLRRRRQLRQTR